MTRRRGRSTKKPGPRISKEAPGTHLPSPAYEGADLRGALSEVTAPTYSAVVDWMEATEGRAISFDCWARGNYVRRLLWNRKLDLHPLLVAAHSAAEMRWAYRRLALLGLPTEFVYCGPLSDPVFAFHLYPMDMILDSGWGYMAALGSRARIAEREFFPIMGSVRPIPEIILHWLLAEAKADFLAGRLFVAPAELIGLHPGPELRGVEVLTDLVRGTPLMPRALAGQAFLELPLPYVDGLNPADFQKLVADLREEIAAFRAAFLRLVFEKQLSGNDARTIVSEVQDEVARILHSDTHAGTRRVIGRLGATLATVSVSLDLALAATAGTYIPIASGVGAAGAVLVELWERHREAQSAAGNPYRLLWKLKADKLEVPTPSLPPSAPTITRTPRIGPFHWLAPPTNGMLFPSVRVRE